MEGIRKDEEGSEAMKTGRQTVASFPFRLSIFNRAEAIDCRQMGGNLLLMTSLRATSEQQSSPTAAGHCLPQRKANVCTGMPFINQCSKLGKNRTRPFLGQRRPAALHREKLSGKLSLQDVNF